MTTRLRLTLDATSSDIFLDYDLLARAPDLFTSCRSAQLILVTDHQVRELYTNDLRDRLEAAGYSAVVLEMPGGEEGKTLDTLALLYQGCLKLNVARDDVIVAVGGGVVGDTAGLLAATYLRGLRFVQVPTTLVAMLTASVGGKVGVNFQHYKNLIGAFKQPEIVLADLTCLETLPAVELRSGLGELVTVGVLGVPEIFDAMQQSEIPDLAPLVAAAIGCKIDIVERDPFERTGLRAHLNLGHTFGHALEYLSDFQLAHGLAVAIGLHTAARLAAASDICPPQLPGQIEATLQRHDLPTAAAGYRSDELIEVMRKDKKARQGKLRFVLPERIGKVRLVGEDELPAGLLESILDQAILAR